MKQYEFITNPKTGKKVKLDGELGKQILLNYIERLNIQQGGHNGPCSYNKAKNSCSKGKKWDRDKCHIKKTKSGNNRCYLIKKSNTKKPNKSGKKKIILTKWTCPACTFINKGSSKNCIMCGIVKPPIKKLKTPSDESEKKYQSERPEPLDGYVGPGPYIEAQVSHNCAKHAINHILQEDKVIVGNLDNLWTPDHLIPPANRGGLPLTNPHKKLRMHFCALQAARQEVGLLELNTHVNKEYLETNGFFDFKDGNWGIKTIIYALNDVFNFRIDEYYNHGGKIWNGDAPSIGSINKNTLQTAITNPDLLGFILNIVWTDEHGQIHRHFIALHNKWNGCHPGGGAANHFTYFESITDDTTRRPVWGCGSFKDIMNWIDSEYDIPAIVAIYKNRDATGTVISYNCPGCN